MSYRAIPAAPEKSACVFPFGKHKGKDIEDIPSAYFSWADENLDEKDHADLLTKIRAELRYRRQHCAHVD